MLTLYQRKYGAYIAAFAVILLIVLLLLSPLKIKYDVETVARIIPAREWLIQRNTDGSMISSVKDYRTGFTENYFAVQVERGDVVHFRINPALQQQPGISVGDTVGYIQSNEIERRLAELKGQREIAYASLDFFRSGEKAAVISEARQNAELSREQAILQQRLYDRQQMLYEQQLVSEEDIEMSRSASRISQLEAELAKARLQTVSSGAKPEQLQLVWSEIERYEKEIRVLESRLDNFTIRSTINGKIYKSFEADNLLMAGEDNFLLMIPVPWAERSSVVEGGTVTLMNESRSKGRIIRVNGNAGMLNGKQVFTAIAELEEAGEELMPYLYSNCKIDGAQLTLAQYLGKFIQKMFSR